MQLHINLPNQLPQQSKELYFEIYFENEGKFYPYEYWTDFGIVILNWWRYAINQYYENSECVELMFMDGNYCLEFDENFNSIIGKSSIEELDKLINEALLLVESKQKF